MRMGRLELPHLSILEPKSSASTNSATSALRGLPCTRSFRLDFTISFHALGKQPIGKTDGIIPNVGDNPSDMSVSARIKLIRQTALHRFYIFLQPNDGLIDL